LARPEKPVPADDLRLPTLLAGVGVEDAPPFTAPGCELLLELVPLPADVVESDISDD